MLSNLELDRQLIHHQRHADRSELNLTSFAITMFIQHELDASRDKVTLLQHQGSQQTELSTEHGVIQFKLLRHLDGQTAATRRRPLVVVKS